MCSKHIGEKIFGVETICNNIFWVFFRKSNLWVKLGRTNARQWAGRNLTNNEQRSRPDNSCFPNTSHTHNAVWTVETMSFFKIKTETSRCSFSCLWFQELTSASVSWNEIWCHFMFSITITNVPWNKDISRCKVRSNNPIPIYGSSRNSVLWIFCYWQFPAITAISPCKECRKWFTGILTDKEKDGVPICCLSEMLDCDYRIMLMWLMMRWQGNGAVQCAFDNQPMLSKSDKDWRASYDHNVSDIKITNAE